MQQVWGFIAGTVATMLAAWLTSRATNRATRTAGVRVDVDAYRSAAEMTAGLIEELRREVTRLRNEVADERSGRHELQRKLNIVIRLLQMHDIPVPAEVA